MALRFEIANQLSDALKKNNSKTTLDTHDGKIVVHLDQVKRGTEVLSNILLKEIPYKRTN